MGHTMLPKNQATLACRTLLLLDQNYLFALGAIVSVSETAVENNLVGVAFKSSEIAVNANLTVTYSITELKP